MSDAAKAILAFGYDLGGYDCGWSFSYKPTSRFRDVIEQNRTHGEAIENYIIGEFGFTEDSSIQGYWPRRTSKMLEIGIEIIHYGTYAYPGYILTAPRLCYAVDDFGSRSIVFPTTSEMKAAENIKAAYEKLHIIPKYNPNPTWTLAAFYG